MKGSIRIIGAPVDLGQSHRGVDMGPSAIRYAGLLSRLRELGYNVTDEGNIQVRVRDSLSEDSLLKEITTACETAYQLARRAIEDNCKPIFLGGDHSISIGTIGGVSHSDAVGVIWIDAHGDFNTPQTSTSGNIHGMSLSVLSGNGLPELVNIGRKGPKIKPGNVVLIGVRSLDPKERENLKKSGIVVYTMRDIDEEGMNVIARKALMRLNRLSRIHVSLDIDSLDPIAVPGVGTPVSGGLTYREAHLLMEVIADSGLVCSMDIVEINPIIDHCNQTAKTAVDLAVSLFGKRIL
ncbi:MAG: arginase [Desulfobacteraceae bacterium]|nr:MAG: arginase [Desulfobacteraceae bacterium]